MRCSREFFRGWIAKLTVLLAAAATGALPAGEPPAPHPLVWEAMAKTVDVQPGDGAAAFVFKVTNTSRRPVRIDSVRPSCGCTIVDLPRTPWILAPGESGSLQATVDFTGKDGTLAKTLAVESAAGTQTLLMHVNLPAMDAAARVRNQQVAQADRQAVFRGDCASCHAAPAAGKKGAELFLAVCAVCHISPHRATMVPDLLVARERRDAAYWRKWIGEGKAETLMPAFAQGRGGPLTDAQIESLVEFALGTLPTEPRPAN